MSGHSAAPLFVVLVVPLALVPLIGVLLAAVAWFRGAKLLGLAGALLSLASPSTAAGCSLAIRWWTRPYVDAPSASAGDAFTLGHFPVRSVHIRVT